ncbi:UPF0280 family protein [Seohaeicola saemankumensis]|nr:UPF0280 family protein [Seohaeicola saemankumensis]MCA0873015.1 UPF0280 family protein [Seohaeicola saemankumensis]
MPMQAAMLPDGRRMHLHHGPIDLIVDAEGPGRAAALTAACTRFDTVLDELVPELPALRTPVARHPVLSGRIARHMLAATAPYAPRFVTPMAAVAGAVADTVLSVMIAAGPLRRAYVNNGGDIALRLSGDAEFTAAIAAGRHDTIRLTASSPVRGIATSGWRGRSQSLGIADGVTVLAATAAQADAAATLIGNAVDLPGSDKVTRRPARDLSPDSDLGDRPVTVDVAPLTDDEAKAALARGRAFAETCLARGLICAAHLTLSGQALSLTPSHSPKDLTHA